jgi:hypothetical protein
MASAGEYLAAELECKKSEWKAIVTNGHLTHSNIIEACFIGILGEYSVVLRHSNVDPDDDETYEAVTTQPK